MRGKIFLIFWVVFMLFFAILFPMLMYYSIKSDNIPNLSERNPWFSLVLVVVSILLWVILFIAFYRKLILRNFSTKRYMEQFKVTGIRREAVIMDVIKLSNLKDTSHNINICKLVLKFKNLVDSEIVQRVMVNDTKPYEHRFEVGKKVDVLIDNDLKRFPYFILANAEVTLKKKTVAFLVLGWFAFLCLVVAYYGYSYQSESDGMGWRFMSLGHPLLICPIVLLFYRFVLLLMSGKFRRNGKTDQAFLIKFKGIETTAKVIKTSQTGTYINDLPMVDFELEFLDYRNQKHHVNLKKVVRLLDLDMTKQEHISIFYLREDPQQVAFTKDLTELNSEF